MLDFNDIAPPRPSPASSQADLESLRAQLIARLPTVLASLYPAGKTVRGKFLIGDAMGSPGRSLEIVLDGDKAGLWTDRAAGLGGDAFDLLALLWGIDVKHDFVRLLERVSELLGHVSPPASQDRKPTTTIRAKANPAIDELGPATGKWDYLDANGQLIAVVYRYDPPGGKKEFRPWDVKRRKAAPPDPRPLYNQPGLRTAGQVILVEGEKCAQALIDIGITATTAMHGANAPVDKTDWSPLKGKAVLIWPDRDKPGFAYAEQAARAVMRCGAVSCTILLPPGEQPEGWDAADAVAGGFDVQGFVATGPTIPVPADPGEMAVDFQDLDWRTEDGMACAFTRRFGDDWRYVAAWGRWYAWNGQRWVEDQVLLVQTHARQIGSAASSLAETPSIKSRLASASTMAAIERLARCDRRHAENTRSWDTDPWLLNTAAGIVDLRSGRTTPHRREAMLTKTASAAGQGEAPLWLSFLADITGGDTEFQAYLQRVVGYCLTGSTEEHALFFLYGTGANGKSVFINVISTILGDYARHAPMETFMDSQGERHPTELASLRGARLVCAVETEQGRRWSESKIKALTAGDRIAARFMRQDFFEYTPQFKLMIAGNHKPSIRNVDEAMKRRLHMIPFTVTIAPERRDHQLTGKLLAQRSGILAWAIQGSLQWQRDGLIPPAPVCNATQEYFESEDAYGQWIDECCQRMSLARVATAVLYASWRQWGERTGEFVGSIKRFAEMLISRGFEPCRLHGGTRAFKGLSVRPDNRYVPGSD